MPRTKIRLRISYPEVSRPGLKVKKMKTAEQYRENADNCAQMVEAADNEPSRNRFKRMEAAWRALAEEQDWLDGEKTAKRSG